MNPYRVLITGSRTWVQTGLIYRTLNDRLAIHGPRLVIVHGHCQRGADAITDGWCTRTRVPVERFPADWSLGIAAGFIRNQIMVDTRPDEAVAFIVNQSPGASDCARRCVRAGIPLRTYMS